MEERQLRPVPRRPQGRLQPARLPIEDLLVVTGLLLLEEPAPGAAQGVLPVEEAVVVEDVDGGDAVLPEKAPHLGGGVPPVVVVALHNKFPARQAVDPPEVLQALGEIDAPGDRKSVV